MSQSIDVMHTLRNENYFDSHNHILLQDLINNEQFSMMKRWLKRAGKEELLNETSLFVFAVPEKDIPVGSSFNIAYESDMPMKYKEIKAQLKFVNVNPSHHTEILPEGYSGICLFEFSPSIPKFLNKLKVYGEDSKVSDSKMYYFTQNEVFKRIEELYI